MKNWIKFFLIGCLLFLGGGLLIKADESGWGMGACVAGILVMAYGLTRSDGPTE